MPLLRPKLDLPGVFTPHALREGGDARARAVALAPAGGAGTLAWVSAYGRAEAAVVLEPELPLGAARLALLAAGNALVDALGLHGPPEVELAWRWPGTLLVNAGECGRLFLEAPPGAAADAVPDWLVVGFTVTLAFPGGPEPGRDPGRTSLEEEGFGGIDADLTAAGLTSASLTSAWARHLMAGLDAWAAAGHARLAGDFLARLVDGRDEPGLRRGIDPATGALVLERAGARRHLALT